WPRDWSSDVCSSDLDYLEWGSDVGYRSYHFFVKVPTPVNIYGDLEMRVCEVQARTELQHVWAVKSHDLLYKPELGLDLSDENVEIGRASCRERVEMV